MWSLLNTDQLISFVPLMPLHFSPNTLAFFQILSFAHGDLLLLELFYSFTLARFLSPSRSPPFAENFSALGYDSSGLFQSTSVGIFFSLLAFLLFLFLLAKLLSRLCRSSPFSRCARCLSWCPFLRLVLEAFLELTLCASLAVFSVSPIYNSSLPLPLLTLLLATAGSTSV